MFTSAADVFRTRQVIADLTALIMISGRPALARISPGNQSVRRLLRIMKAQGGRLRFPPDRGIYGEILLAAALPDEDYPAFTSATALLLLDRIAGGDGEDDLYWNWDAFHEHYRLADPQVRSTLMNAFRLAAMKGRAVLPDPPDPVDCLTLAPDDFLPELRRQRQTALLRAIENDASAEEAGAVWTRLAPTAPAAPILAGVRYLYERPRSLVPLRPAFAPVIPWPL